MREETMWYVAFRLLVLLAPLCLCGLAQAEEPSTQSSVSLAEFRRKAEQGDAVAQASLGMRYAGGVGGVEQDIAEAAKWFRLAAD
jgi:hypothetical protein